MFETDSSRAWLEQLNDQQRIAVTHAGGPLLILAGAGTGKTTTLCSRVAWLLSEGVAAERLLLLTFTRRAAREMIQRARGLAERAMPNAGRVVGGTFHSVAHSMIRLHASSLGLAAGFGVIDAGDAADVLDLVRQERGHAASVRRFPRARTMLDIYSRTVNAQIALADVLVASFPWCEEHRDALADTFRAYVARKRELGVLDLDDLLLYWRALARDEVIGPHLASMFEHVLVDEYQDVNGLQVEILRALRSTRRDITVVGDDFQAIYGFRSASARHILEFPHAFPGAEVIKLERNYRSTSPILAVANAVSRQDGRGYPKRLWSDREGGASPELLFPRDDGDQAHHVCDRVLAVREEGIVLRSQAVLFRAGHDSDLLELELTRCSIPFVKYGGLRYLEAAHVKDLIALLRLATNPADEVSWFRLLQLVDGVGPVGARRILDALRPPGGGPPQLSRWPDAGQHLPTDSLAPASGVIEALASPSGEVTAASRIEQLCSALTPLIRIHYSDWAARVSDYEQLLALARGANSIESFVSDLVLDPPASSADVAGPPHLDEDYLILSTVHSAKGLEWDAVHLIAAYDGNFPADMNAATAESIAEERRLFYVALTRPRRRLYVYVPFRYYHRPHARDDGHGYGKASRFLTDEVTRLFTVTHSGEIDRLPADPHRPERRIAVSVDALFG